MAQIIDFPAARVVRHPDLIETFEKLELLDEYDMSRDPAKLAVAGPMREYWEAELTRLGGVPGDRLVRDGVCELLAERAK